MIGLWSPAPQSGKSTAAEALGDASPRVSAVGFADPLRELIYTFLWSQGISCDRVRRYLHDGSAKEEIIPEVGKSFVQLAIALGTTFGRDFIGEDCWVAPWRRGTRQLLNSEAIVVTDDMRFPNEAEAVRAAGGILIGIVRPGATVSTQRAAAEGHLTESDMDAVIYNEGSIEDLEERVLRVAKRLGVRL